MSDDVGHGLSDFSNEQIFDVIDDLEDYEYWDDEYWEDECWDNLEALGALDEEDLQGVIEDLDALDE